MMQKHREGEVLGSAELAEVSPEPDEKEVSRAVELVCATVALALNGAMIWGASQIELRGEAGGIDPRWWPFVLSLTGLGMAAVLLALALTGRGKHFITPTNAQGLRSLLLVAAATAIFVTAWRYTDFFASATVFLLTLILIFGERRWKVLVFFPLGMTTFVYVMFQTLLQVPL